MEDGAFIPNCMPVTLSETTMDFDLMDELLYDGCWLETTDGSNFWQPCPSTSSALNFPAYCFPTSENNMDHLNTNPHQKSYQEENFGNNPPVVYSQIEEPAGSQMQNQEAIQTAASSGQSESFLVEGTEMSRRLWIAPSRNLSSTSSVKKRLMLAVEYLKELTSDRDALIQIWVPIKRGGRHVLTTNNQPFSLNPNCKSLADYRNVSTSYRFAAEENSKESVGLPGRVFLKKLPEWTPDVRFFRKEEYPRVNYAQQYNVCGSLALPVFERGSGTCLGVVEVVTTTQKANCHPELENVCKALEAVDLRSSEIFSAPKVKAWNVSYQNALTEIQEVLKSVCDMHGLPLAQTWAPCIQHGKGGCRHSDENYAACVSTIDSACYVPNPQVLGFHEACSEHHLLRGEGVAGGAFMTNQPCFAADVTVFSKTEYPLSHHARMFGLHGAMAIRLRSIYTESADFVLEFFLPLNCQDSEEQKGMLNSLSSVLQQVCQNLRVITDQELEDETILPVSEMVAPSGGRLNKEFSPKHAPSSSNALSQEKSSWIAHMMEGQQKGNGVAVSFGYQNEEPKDEFKVTTHWDNNEVDLHHAQISSPKQLQQDEKSSWIAPMMEGQQKGNGVAVSLGYQNEEPKDEFNVTTLWDNNEVDLHHAQISSPKQLQQDSELKGTEGSGDFSSVGWYCPPGARKAGEKRRAKMEKTISLQVLRQHFAGSLKDAAKSIGVCPTTLKRICRQHGIARWPSRKIKKVGHSLKKLQLIIESVEGSEGAIQLASFYNNFPELRSPSATGTTSFSTSKIYDHLKELKTQPEGSLLSPDTTSSKSPSSSCNHSSSSSLCCSTGAKQPPVTTSAFGGGDALFAEEPTRVLKRACSEAYLHDSGQEEMKVLARSQSHYLFGDHHSLEALPPLLKTSSQVLKDAGTFRIKATFGEEKIRFTMQQTWGFGDLQQEIARRFSIEDTSTIDLKYLDDDSEWILLTCDADLEECIDIYRSSKFSTIKISIHLASHPNYGSSFGSSGPS